MASLKMLCIVFILTLFGEIRANTDSDALAASKHIGVDQVFPPSILYLLRSRPIGGTQPCSWLHQSPGVPLAPVPVAPTAPVPPTLPFAPVPPTLPVAPKAPVPLTPPVAPTPPSSDASSANHLSVHQMFPPSILYLLSQRPTRRPHSSQPAYLVPSSPSTAPQHPYSALYPSYPRQSLPSSQQAYPTVANSAGPRVSQTYNPIRSAPLPGQLSYDNPSNGNRKLLNVVHIPLNRPVSFTPSKVVPNSQAVPQSAVNIPVNTPIGPAPLSPEASTSQTEDLSPLPSDTVGISSIPAKPEAEKELSDTKTTITINVNDLQFQPVNNIEASPIPVRPNDKANSGTKDTDKSEDSVKPEDLSPGPVVTMGSSPIPSKPSDINKSDDTSNNSSQEPTTDIAPSTFDISDQDYVSKDDTKDNNAEPNQETSINNESDKNNVSEENTSHRANAATPDVETGNTQEKTKEESPEKTEEVQNSLGNLGLDGTSSNGNTQTEKLQDNPLKDVILNGGTSSNGNVNTQTEKPQDSPLKDVILNSGSPSNVSENSQTTDCKDNPLKDVIVNDSTNVNKNTQVEDPKDNPLKDVIVNDKSSNDNKNSQTEESNDNPLKDVIINDASSSDKASTPTKNPQDNPLKDVILNGNENKPEDDKNNSSEESSNEVQSESSQEKNEETQSETSKGSSHESISHDEENTDASSK